MTSRPPCHSRSQSGTEPWLGVLRKKYNSEWVDRFVPQMTARGKELGIFFDFTGEVGNSLDSLRLLAWSAKYGKQEELANVMAVNHFEKKMCVGNHANLLSAVDEAHLPRAEARTILEGVEFRDQVLQQYSEIQAAGVYAIPVFIFEIEGRREVVSGAASVSEYASVLRNLLEAQ